jgi:hypothetical protein
MVLFRMSLLGRRAKALVKHNRKKFEAANQQLLSKQHKGNEEAPLHPPMALEDPYRVILASELPSDQCLNWRKHNDVILGKGTDGKSIYQQTGLQTFQLPPSRFHPVNPGDDPVQPPLDAPPDNFFDFHYGFDAMDHHISQDGHPVLHQQQKMHLVHDKQSHHSCWRYSAAHKWNTFVLPHLVHPYMAFRVATNSGCDPVQSPTEATLCRCGDPSVQLKVTCVYLKCTPSDPMMEPTYLYMFLQVYI